MSMKIKGRLMDKGSSRIEAAYAGKMNVIKLEDVPCELTFKAGAAYVEHEDEKHHYLPCFKLRGIIDEVRGDFPYHISSVYFADDDQNELTKTISYYPTPKELAHMIEVGGFYSRRFVVPDVISENVYSFPALVDLVIVPPPNPAAYEAATYDPMADAMDLNSVNLPVVYVRLKGSGINRKTDPLLDYYDIDLDDSFQMFAMTADSSGYRQPQLLEYITEPEPEPEAEQLPTDTIQRVDEMHYITPEEEAQMLSGKDTSFQKQMEDVEPAFKPANPEDALLLKTSDEISRRIKEKHVEKPLNFGRQHTDDLLRTRERETIERSQNKVLDGASVENKVEKTVENPKVNEAVKPSFTQDVRKVQLEPIAKPVVTPEKPKRPSFSSIIMTEAAARAAERRNRLSKPDVPQQQAEVKMDFNPEANAFVTEKREEKKLSGENIQEKDVHSLQDMKGADVADARDQAKVDDERVMDLAQDVARSVQESIVSAQDVVADVKVEGEKVVSGMEKTVKDQVKPNGKQGSRDTGDLPDFNNVSTDTSLQDESDQFI